MRFSVSIPALVACFSLIGPSISAPAFLDKVFPSLKLPIPSETVDRRQNSVAVTGAQGQTYPRLEIRDLRKNADQWNIYLLGLNRFYNLNQSDPMSYFQISGIHGRPAVNWFNTPGVGNPSFPGYCTHASNLFLPWHRPYLALYEQALIKNAIDVANSFTGEKRNRYLSAASTLRTPYWDWAMVPPSGENVVPDFLVQPNINVITPENPNGFTSIPNPLYSYRFHPNPGSNPNDPNNLYYYPWSQMAETIRAPSSNNNPNAVSRNNVVVNNFNTNSASLRSRIYTLLTNYEYYQTFSNSAWEEMGNTADSLESVHDNVHGFIGGGHGHMSILDFAAFDPMFWLHHAMVDRIAALWQIIHPGTYVDPAPQSGGSWWYSEGDVLDADTGLSPFFSPSGGFWNSNGVRTMEVFNYNYPGISRSTSQASARSMVNQLYGSRGRASGRSPLSYDVARAGSAKGNSLDYVAVIKAPKHGWPITYFIYLFLGEPTVTEVGSLMSDPTFVGLQSVISMYGGMDNNEGVQGSTLIGSTIPLNEKLLETPDVQNAILNGSSGNDTYTGASGGYNIFSEANEPALTAYLERRLQWRIVDANGQVVSPDQIPELEIAVISQKVSPATSADTFPKWIGETRYLPTITRNKVAGFRGNRPEDRPKPRKHSKPTIHRPRRNGA